jgi:hypothetical protein
VRDVDEGDADVVLERLMKSCISLRSFRSSAPSGSSSRRPRAVDERAGERDPLLLAPESWRGLRFP